MHRKNRTRHTNVDLLNKWLIGQGTKGMAALLGTGLSVYTINKIINGTYPSSPKGITRKAFSDVTGIPEAELFPPVRSGKKKASEAS